MASKIAGYGSNKYRDHGADFALDADMEPRALPMYSKQDQVQKLPVPPLDHTFKVFLESAQPHCNEKEFQELTNIVKEFGKKGGLAEELQQRLLKLQESRKDSSWLIKYWNELGYLGYRDSVVWNVSYGLQFEDEMAVGMRQPTRRAARFVKHALSFRDLIMSGNLSIDMNKGKPMSMTQYKFMYNTSRMPGPNQMDFVRTYAPDLFHHIVVARKNRFFVFDVVDPVTGQAKSVDEIQVQLDRVVKMADQLGTDYHPVGILTADDRDVWYENRELLVSKLSIEQCKQNQAALELIESSILAVCLDDTSPTTQEDILKQILHSDGCNRFWDKSIQVIFFENGSGGYCGEHSMMDGTTTTRMVNYCLENMAKDDDYTIGGEPDMMSVSSLLPEPQHVQIALDGAAEAAIAKAQQVFQEIIGTKELSNLTFYGFGKQQIKKFKVSPDAFAQLAIQYAYYKTFGVCRGTYESTQTRSFLHGRTEVTRSCTNASLDFCQSMVGGKTSLKDLHGKLLKATQNHSAYSGLASKGMACDRHLLGLKLMMKPGESSDLFSHPGFSRSGTWALSTSGLVGNYLKSWAFGEVVPHGVGIGYSVQDNRLAFTVSSRHKTQCWAPRMTTNLKTALLEMRTLCEVAATVPQSKL